VADGVRSKVTLSLVTMLRGSTPRTAERRGRAGNLPVGVDASVAVMAPRKTGGRPLSGGGPAERGVCRTTRPGPRPVAGQEVDGAPGDADDVARAGSDRWRCRCWLRS